MREVNRGDIRHIEVERHRVEDLDGPSAFLGDAQVPREQLASFIRAQFVEVTDRIEALRAYRPDGDTGPEVEAWLEQLAALRAVCRALESDAKELGVKLEPSNA